MLLIRFYAKKHSLEDDSSVNFIDNSSEDMIYSNIVQPHDQTQKVNEVSIFTYILITLQVDTHLLSCY